LARHIIVNPDAQKTRWICYLDLLGFKKLVLGKGWLSVFASYSKTIERLKRSPNYASKTRELWFSDTFVLYTEDDTLDSFLAIEQKARYLTYFLITDGIPLRGSIAFGEYYADENTGIQFGKALIEAYEYGEGQDWIGLIQCPSAVAALEQRGIEVDAQLNYPIWEIPFKESFQPAIRRLPTYRIGEHAVINGRNLCLDALHDMRRRVDGASVLQKYDRTIAFLERNRIQRGE